MGPFRARNRIQRVNIHHADQALVGDYQMAAAAGAQHFVAVVFQRDAVFPWLTVRQNLEYGPRMTGLPRRTWAERVEEYLFKVGLTEYAHLHFDHIGNTELFPNAQFFVHTSEIPMLISPPRYATFYYREWKRKLTNIADRLIPVAGGFHLTKNIEVVRIGGHSPGQLAVFVQTGEGRVCLASDFLYNYVNLRQEWPIGPIWNMDEWMAGLRFLKGESDIIIPNHDFEFYQHFPEGIIG